LIRVVVDTSVLIRYLIKPSTAIRELIEDHWLDGDIQLVTAPSLIDELRNVLQRDYIKALIRPEEGQALLEALYRKADILPQLGEVPSFTRDPKDDKFIACALVGSAEYVVSVDKDLLVLRALQDLRVMTPYDFANRSERES
jgi:putative PIN family toxin of toxin-antitoxin system